ncbi:hypothetical protein [Streptomyces sp. NPDC102476]|uniref:MmyB family transcriptional regulator n=1 Tax=Streptomyces sp. NPDC102476 TaxID=3366181 RepID=UPI0037F36093
MHAVGTGTRRPALGPGAGRSGPSAHGPPAARGPTAHVQPGLLGLLGLLDQLTATPAQVTPDLHQTLARNPLAAARRPAPGGARPRDQPSTAGSPIRTPVPSVRPRTAHHSWVFVADLQAVAARRGDDTEVHQMVAALRPRSEAFITLWDTHDVAPRRTDRKRIAHATLDVIELDCHSLFSEDGRRRLLWFSAPPGTEGAAQG